VSELEFVKIVSDEDLDHLIEKEKSYKDSWKKSGGRSAWFMLKRKIDRLVFMLEKEPHDFVTAKSQHDIFECIKKDPSGRDGTILAEIRDLRRYLLLVEAEMMNQKIVTTLKWEKDDESLHYIPYA
jgi:hypothetical protein